jgi:hypothetical protein
VRICIAILIAANISIYRVIFAPRALEVSVLNVGKGNATPMRTPSKMTILVNAGPDASILRALGAGV